MPAANDILIRKLKEHTRLARDDVEALRTLTFSARAMESGEDAIRQGDRPNVSIMVMEGMVARYHTRRGGSRQYLSFHVAGDLPDVQALFLDRMDHSVCAIGPAAIGLVAHSELLDLIEQRISIGYALWRETLIDAAIFREAITNNASRPVRSRMAHFFCEQYYRAQAAGLAEGSSCSLPVSQVQLGEALGMSVVTINRTLQSLRRTGAVEFRGGVLNVRNWKRLADIGEFDSRYLHLRKQP
jgi:CRP-like cAMP-binding protein